MYNTRVNEEKVMNYLFDNSETIHIRSLARLLKIHPNTVSRITDALEKKGLLSKNKDKETRIVEISPNILENNFKLLKKFHNIRKLFASGLIDFFNDELVYPTIILFGSYSKGENHKESDIDLFIIADEKKDLDLKKYENRLGKIQTIIHDKNGFRKLMKKSPELANNIVNGYILSGFLDLKWVFQNSLHKEKSNSVRKTRKKQKR